MPPAISAAPLMATIACGLGISGGMMARYVLGFAKWLMPAAMKSAPSAQARIGRFTQMTTRIVRKSESYGPCIFTPAFFSKSR